MKHRQASSHSTLVRAKEVRKIIEKLKPRKAPGLDGIDNRLLKNLSQKVVVKTVVPQKYLMIARKNNRAQKPGKDGSIPTNYRPTLPHSAIDQGFRAHCI